MDEGTAKLYAKYWGNMDLAHTEGFWEDVYEYYSHEYRDAPLPLVYNPTTVRLVLDGLGCAPGVCTECCYYNRIWLEPRDVERIVENTDYTKEDLDKLITTENGRMFLNGQPDGCHFLSAGGCTIHFQRPDVCYFFPIGGRTVESGGKEVKQMFIRIKCPEALNIAREVITKSLKENQLLLPDLTIIPKYTGVGED